MDNLSINVHLDYMSKFAGDMNLSVRLTSTLVTCTRDKGKIRKVFFAKKYDR